MEEGGVSEREALAVAERLRARRKSTGKSKLSGSAGPLDRSPQKQPAADSKKKPFGVFKQKWLACAGELSEPEQLRVVEQAIEVFSLLPRESKYAQHRLKLLRKIQDILKQEK
jgi:hypothetical protein